MSDYFDRLKASPCGKAVEHTAPKRNYGGSINSPEVRRCVESARATLRELNKDIEHGRIERARILSELTNGDSEPHK
ncbi:MAG: hypothetical protein ACR2JC_06205 [Chloroflexota bacterium]|nr:MAG: hypothetical protein DLM70_14470 [Chloroflexota bacterium]